MQVSGVNKDGNKMTKKVEFKGNWIDIKPLGILMCSGNSMPSKAIIGFNRFNGYRGQAARTSHIARVIWNPYILPHPDLFVLESTTHNEWIDDDGNMICNKKGVQVNTFTDFLKFYDGEISIRNFAHEAGEHAKRVTVDHVKKYVSAPYESGIKGLRDLLDAVKKDDGPVERDECFDGIHCSEDSTILSKDLSHTRIEIPANSISPAEHYPGGRFDKTLTMPNLYLPPLQIK